MPFAVCILDGIWIVWYACWKRQSHDWRECETSLRRWRWSFLEKSCYPYLWSNCQGMHAVLFSLDNKILSALYSFLFLFIVSLFHLLESTIMNWLLDRKLKEANEENQNILNGGIMMIWTNTSGIRLPLVAFFLFSK